MTLRNFVREASKHAEGLFDPDDQMLAHIIAERRDGGIEVYVCPMSGPDEEVMFRVSIPSKLKASGKFRWWCFFSEAWAVEYSEACQLTTLPEDHSERFEVITFVAESRTGEQVKASRQIYRGEGLARLMPLVWADKPQKFVMRAPTTP